MTQHPALSLVEIGRVKMAVERFGDRFLKRLFTAAEMAYCMPRAARHQHLASRLAAKVAVRSAFRDAGLRPPPWRSMEVERDRWGKPSITQDRPEAGIRVLLSISHSRRYAAASVILITASDA